MSAVRHTVPDSRPASPCNGVCRMQPRTGYCAGCWRSIDEIAQWAAAGDDYKQAVLTAIAQRRHAG